MQRRPWQPPPPPPWGQGGPPRPPDWQDARAKLESGYGRVRDATRGLLLPMFTWPLLPDAMWEIGSGDTLGTLAALVGLGLPVLAVFKLRRGLKGDTNMAALLTAGATGTVALLGAGMNPVLAALLAGGSWLGTRLLYDGAVQEVAPPEPPPPPSPLDEARSRLARIAEEPRLVGVAGAMAGVLDDLGEHPERLTEARRFLAVHLDGLDRIRERLEAGAEPPPGLPKLLEDLTSAADELRDKLRAEETAALDIQVKVLSDRLRQEGYA